ncbi:MAG TPA: 2-oxo acid dehydrogenase subunit E2 [Ktedonobacteraceae bacterium]|nr:2-oxo acid dehydrogenase subunit E2 [Ktedonobacteraceae bacterium]
MRNRQRHDYKVVPYTKLRRILALMYPAVQRKPVIHGLLEVDVTKAREFLRDYKTRTGESLSFTAFIAACLARAIDENKSLQACRQGSRRLVLFDAVDIAIPIERVIAGQKQPIIYIIRGANKKTFREIHHEVRAAQGENVAGVWEGFRTTYALRFLPLFLFRIGWWAFCRARRSYPQVQKKYGGTVGITAVGMFGKGGGWGIPVNDHTLDLTLGGITVKPGVIDGQIMLREYLSLTLSFDHSIVDGAPATRFSVRLRELIESGYGLCKGDKV